MQRPPKILQEIEQKHPVDTIRINGESFWPFFRLLIFSLLNADVVQVHKKNYLTPFRKMRNALFGVWMWRKKWDYFFFSNEMERKTVGGKTLDKLTEYTNESLGFKTALYVEHVEKRHLPKCSYHPKQVASFDFILVLAGLLKFIDRSSKNVEIENEACLKQILAEYDLTIDYRTKLTEFLQKVKLLQWIFTFSKPKVVFITDYGNMHVIYAAKSISGVKTVEFQHGVIGMAHEYYHPLKKLNNTFCPDFLLVFGEHDLESLSHGNYVLSENILPVGNFLLDSIKRLPLRKEIVELIKPFERSVCVPTDRITHEYLLDFIKDVARELPNIIFIISPRNTMFLNDNNALLPPNIYIEKTISFQEIVRHCTVNSCTNSTCCLEALTLGVPNILIDEDGLTFSYFGKILTNKKTTKFAKTKKEYIEMLKDFEPIPVDEITYSNLQNYKPNYRENLQKALKRIML